MTQKKTETESAQNKAASISSSQDVWYRLMKLSNLVNRPFFSEDAKQYQININEWRMIMTLAYMNEAAAHELADASGLHPMNVSRSLAVLRRQSRVSVRVDPDNRRRKLFILTGKGLRLFEEITPHMKERADQLFSLVAKKDIDQFGKIIDQLILGLMYSSE
jgi:DNA-binding MarR family transcriptional regulator